MNGDRQMWFVWVLVSLAFVATLYIMGGVPLLEEADPLQAIVDDFQTLETRFLSLYDRTDRHFVNIKSMQAAYMHWMREFHRQTARFERNRVMFELEHVLDQLEREFGKFFDLHSTETRSLRDHCDAVNHFFERLRTVHVSYS